MASPTQGFDLSQVDLPDTVRVAVEALAGFDGVEKIILFGSRAIGDHDPRSDIDVAISGLGLDRAKLAEIRDRIGRARTLYKITIADFDTMPKLLRERVQSQGMTIYERAKA